MQNALAVIAVIEVIVLPFMGFSIANFFKILLVSLVVVMLVAVLASSLVENRKNQEKHVGKTVRKTTRIPEPELFEPRPAGRDKGQKLVNLDKRIYNWQIADVERNNPKNEEPVTENRANRGTEEGDEIKKRYNPYRSPFEPINPQIGKKEGKIQEQPAMAQAQPVMAPVGAAAVVMEEIEQTVEKLEDATDDFSEALFEEEGNEVFFEVDMVSDNEMEPFTYEEDVDEYTAAAAEIVERDRVELARETPLENISAYKELKKEDVKPEISVVHQDKKVVKLIFKPKGIEAQPQLKPVCTELEVAEPKEEKLYILPPVDLLKEQETDENSELFDFDTDQTANKLVETLASFGVGARVLDVSRGPSVTRYELQPNAGVKVSKIVGLADDIALNLAATGVRIEAPIPGKAAVGIEVPNKEVTPVLLRDVIESEEFQKHPSKLAFGVGKDVAGRIIVGDISKMPHMLIAGATGSGKSVCINTLIASILYKASPKEVKLLMVDPKVVELGIYNGIPHLLIPVVTDPKKAAGALNWAVVEMTTRYKLFAENNVRDLRGYNALMRERGEETLPQIVIIIDELADLMMVAPNDVEDCICRLAQMARAAGMHLVIATQRPSVDVITGVIKANIPSRISFAVSSQIDSRTILDMAGAEKLLGRGDMLYNPIGEPKPIRVQGGFISDKEVESIVNEIKMNFQADYDQEVLDRINSQSEQQQPQQQDGSDDDELLPQAIEMVLEHGQASASLIQRKFKVGYSRAARILDQMESWGVVGPAEGSKPRQLLINKQEWDELNS